MKPASRTTTSPSQASAAPSKPTSKPTLPEAVNYISMGRLLAALRALTEAPGNPELPMQTASFFLYIAQRHPTEVPYGEIEVTLGMTQASTSRNAGYLSRGLPPRDGKPRPGYGLIEVYEDPYYTKRKLCRLTSRGVTVALTLTGILQ